MKSIYYLSILLFSFTQINAQVTLDANGPSNTYELINSVLAPGFNVVEVPDCNHSAFGRHIDEIFDADLNTNVFRFSIHVTPDNDRCNGSTDRQRNEIKAYDKSPNNLKGVEGETVIYKWKFKLDAGFQVSSSFTHLHQLKSVGGLYESMPMYTLTARKSNPDRLELRYAETNSQTTLIQTPLAPFKGEWVEATESIKYGTNISPDSGTYSIEIKRVSDQEVLLTYTDNALKNWQTNAIFVRPKWGIYRSLNSASNLRDEEVLFANFSIEEVSSLNTKDIKTSSLKLHPNPVHDFLKIETNNFKFYKIKIHDISGKMVLNDETVDAIGLDVSALKSGIYFISFENQNNVTIRKKFLKK